MHTHTAHLGPSIQPGFLLQHQPEAKMTQSSSAITEMSYEDRREFLLYRGTARSLSFQYGDHKIVTGL